MALAENVANNLMVFTGLMTAMVLVWRLVTSVVNGIVIGRKSAPAASLKALEDRLARIEQIVETSALEIERIGEGQRFTTKVLTERAAAPAALPAPSPRNTLL